MMPGMFRLAGGICCAVAIGCAGPRTRVSTPQSFATPACDGYRFKTQVSGEALLLTITDTTPETRYVGTLTFKAASSGESTFVFSADGSDDVLSDPPPPVQAVLEEHQVCYRLGAGDASDDPCLQERIAAGGFCAMLSD